MSELQWLKSSFSEASGNACVEIATTGPSAIALRESDRPADVLTTDRAALRALVQSLAPRPPGLRPMP